MSNQPEDMMELDGADVHMVVEDTDLDLEASDDEGSAPASETTGDHISLWVKGKLSR